MTQRNVEGLIGQLVTNPVVSRRFAVDPAAVLREFQEAGHELTNVELEALAATSPEAIRLFARSIDRRIRRADPMSDEERVR